MNPQCQRDGVVPGHVNKVVGIVITNTADAFKIELDPVTRERASELSLQLFVAMSLMSMQLWVLSGAVAGRQKEAAGRHPGAERQR